MCVPLCSSSVAKVPEASRRFSEVSLGCEGLVEFAQGSVLRIVEVGLGDLREVWELGCGGFLRSW